MWYQVHLVHDDEKSVILTDLVCWAEQRTHSASGEAPRLTPQLPRKAAVSRGALERHGMVSRSVACTWAYLRMCTRRHGVGGRASLSGSSATFSHSSRCALRASSSSSPSCACACATCHVHMHVHVCICACCEQRSARLLCKGRSCPPRAEDLGDRELAMGRTRSSAKGRGR